MEKTEFLIIPASLRAVPLDESIGPNQRAALGRIAGETIEAQMAEGFFHNAVLGQCPVELTEMDNGWRAEMVWYEAMVLKRMKHSQRVSWRPSWRPGIPGMASL